VLLSYEKQVIGQCFIISHVGQFIAKLSVVELIHLKNSSFEAENITARYLRFKSHIIVSKTLFKDKILNCSIQAGSELFLEMQTLFFHCM